MSLARIGPIQLAPGVGRGHALTFFYAAFIGITLNTYINFIQPYILTEHLQIPEHEQGKLTGNLVFVSELMLLFACGVAGLLVDTLGRRAVFAAGFGILAVGFFLYGRVETENQLLLLRLGLAWGVAAINVMVTTLQADYPSEESRGKLVGMTGFAIGLGALFLVFVLARLPYWFAGLANPGQAGTLALDIVASIAAASALACWLGLKHEPARTNNTASAEPGWLQRLADATRLGGERPRIGLSYACAFVARGDLIVIGVFFSLWLTQTGVANGMETAEAVALAGLYFGVIQGVALLSAPILGVINDKLDRIEAVILALALAAVGYGSLGLIDDPLSTMMIPAAVLLGIGQMAVMLASQTLIGQEAPRAQRGTVMGMFSVCGALGIMFITKVGGAVFDAWKPGPFVIVAAGNVLLCAAALLIWRSERRAQTAAATAAP